jgi:hypothetical protein
MRGRPPTRKKGAYTPAERVRNYRRRLKRSRPDPKTKAKQQRRAEKERPLGERIARATEALGSRLELAANAPIAAFVAPDAGVAAAERRNQL